MKDRGQLCQRLWFFCKDATSALMPLEILWPLNFITPVFIIYQNNYILSFFINLYYFFIKVNWLITLYVSCVHYISTSIYCSKLTTESLVSSITMQLILFTHFVLLLHIPSLLLNTTPFYLYVCLFSFCFLKNSIYGVK